MTDVRTFRQEPDVTRAHRIDRKPRAVDPRRVGTYPAAVKSGGGYVWDAVLEYRVWCYPRAGAADPDGDGSDYYYAFASYPEALAFARRTPGAQAPLALILQKEHIDEPEPGRYVHVRRRRLTEWPVEFLARPRRTARTIPDFLAPDAPANRLDILRGLAPRSRKRPAAAPQSRPEGGDRRRKRR
jgi:putative acetyltransferase